jgi:EF hand domain-containing protein
MAPRISTALGVVAGLVLSLSVALVVVVAGNGTNNPGVMRVSGESAAGGASAPLSRPSSSSEHSAFDGLDIDGDGKLSLAEAAGYGDIVTRFHRLDRNKDGKLTKAEFDRLAKLPPPKARPKAKPRLREDAAAALAAAREGR